MPERRPDSIFQEYIFSPEEAIQAKILTPLQIMWLNTRYSELTKAQANSMIPDASVDDRAFLKNLMEGSGKLAFITELFMNHKEALDALAHKTPPNSPDPLTVVDDVEARAANQVHTSS